MLILDANAVLRYLLKDDTEAAEQVERQIIENDIMVPVEVLAEVVYVARNFYKIPRNILCECLISFTDIISFEKEIIINALNFYLEINIDFVDCVLLARNKIEKINVMSFDKKLNKMLSVYK